MACVTLKTDGTSDTMVLLCILHAVFGHGEKGISVAYFPQVSKWQNTCFITHYDIFKFPISLHIKVSRFPSGPVPTFVEGTRNQGETWLTPTPSVQIAWHERKHEEFLHLQPFHTQSIICHFALNPPVTPDDFQSLFKKAEDHKNSASTLVTSPSLDVSLVVSPIFWQNVGHTLFWTLGLHTTDSTPSNNEL